MKKLLSVILVISMIALFALPASAAPDGDSYGDVKKVDAGVITIDAVKDEAAWANALAVPINRVSPTSPNMDRAGATGTVYLLWSDKGIYVFGEINDATPTFTPYEDRSDPGKPNYNVDSLEVFLDFGNTGDIGNYQHSKVDNEGLGYVTFTTDWAGIIGKEATAPYMEYAGRIEGNTYYVEMLIIPSYGSLKAGDKMGMQFQINDMTDPDLNNGEDRVVVLSPNANDSDSWTTELHNYIVLSAEDANPPPPPPATEDAPVPATAPAAEPSVPEPADNSPKTGDAGIAALSVFMILAAMGTFALRKRAAN